MASATVQPGPPPRRSPVRRRRALDHRTQADEVEPFSPRFDGLDSSRAPQGVALVDGGEVVTRLPSDEEHHPWQSPSHLGCRQPDGVASLDQPSSAGGASVTGGDPRVRRHVELIQHEVSQR